MNIDTKRVVFNLSKKVLITDQERLLSLGLNFCITPFKIDYFKHFLGFEKFCHAIGRLCSVYSLISMALYITSQR